MSTICVHGLGYVGLPTAALFANNGHEVIGIDVNPDRLAELRNGNTGFQERKLEQYVERALDSGHLRLREEPQAGDAHLICVPTPYDQDEEEADLTYVKQAARGIAPHLHSGDTVILESTVPPGTTEELLRTSLNLTSESSSRDYQVAYCPETILPGSILEELRQNDRLVGGVDPESTEAVVDLFEPLIDGTVHRAPDATTAEFVKLIQNTFRDSNIAVANELAKVARDYDIDARCAFDLANTHPRVSLLRPGPGVGGHCLPVDPQYLDHDSGAVDLITHAREINDGMVEYVQEMILDQLDDLSNKRIAIFGIAYKGDVADTRNSPGKRLAHQIAEKRTAVTSGNTEQSVEVRVHDPQVESSDLRLHSRENALDDADALVVMTDHTDFEFLSPTTASNQMRNKCVIDPAGVLTAEEWRDNGFTISQL